MSITFSFNGQIPVTEIIYGEVFQNVGINMGNRNAFDVLRSLGIEPDYSGSIQAQELADKAISACFAGDEGIAPTTYSNPGMATLIECGREIGYLRERAKQLALLALEALKAGETEITWG